MAGLGVYAEFISAFYEAVFAPDGLMTMARLVTELLEADTTCISVVENGRTTEMAVTSAIGFSMTDPLFPSSEITDKVKSHDETDPAKKQTVSKFHRRSTLSQGETNSIQLMFQLASGATVTLRIGRLASKQAMGIFERASLTAILPHMERALNHRLKERKSVSITSHTPILEMLSFGTIVCGRDGTVEFVNSAARKIIRSRAGAALRAKQKTLSAWNEKEDARLLKLISMATDGNESGSIVLTNKNGVRSIIALVLPMSEDLKQAFGLGHAVIAIQSLDAEPQFNDARLSELFGLSPAQTAIAMQLYQGRSFEEIAADRGVKVTTLRSHYAEVLRRTGCDGLRDLVRVFGIIPPIA